MTTVTTLALGVVALAKFWWPAGVVASVLVVLDAREWGV